ncbi:MAG: TolC family protein [Verrucomicrobia bacterium]|nr:TolC family protein [Verrucomicrobiota bacterium]
MQKNCLLILICVLSSAVARADTNAGVALGALPLTTALISQLADEMRTNHPALRSMDARTRAASAGAAAVRTWEDPMVRLGSQVAETAMRADEGDLIYGVEQKLPLFGKPQALRRAAQAEIAVERAGTAYQFQQLRRELAQALFKTALADRVVQVGEQDRGWLETIVAATDAKYRVGQASLAELVQVQNEFAKRTNQLRTDLRLGDNARAIVNRLLNRDLESPWPRLELPPLAAPVPFSPLLVDLALRHEPKTKVLREQVKQSEAMVEVARRQRYPDVAVDLEGRNYTGRGDFRQGMFLLNVSLPWGNRGKYRKDMEREQERASAARFEVADQELSVRQEVLQLTIAIDAARREAVLYRDEILPRTEQALASAKADWETSRRPLRDLLDAYRMLLEARLMSARAVAEQWQMLAELVLCCGLGELDALFVIGVITDAATPAPVVNPPAK